MDKKYFYLPLFIFMICLLFTPLNIYAAEKDNIKQVGATADTVNLQYTLAPQHLDYFYIGIYDPKDLNKAIVTASEKIYSNTGKVTLGGLSPNTSYYARLGVAKDSTGTDVVWYSSCQVITTYGYFESVYSQTAASSSSISVQVNSVPGVTQYKYDLFDSGNHLVNSSIVASTSKTFTGLKSEVNYKARVTPVRSIDGFYAIDEYYIDIPKVACTPKKPSSVKCVSIDTANNYINISTSKSKTADVYETVFYDMNGALVMKRISSSNTLAFTSKKLSKGSYYTMKSRAGIKLSNGKIMYSEYSPTKYFTGLPKATASLKKGKVKIKWNKVSGADYYNVYYRTYNSDYIKIGSKVTTNSLGTKLNVTKGRTYLFKVVPYKVVGNKKYKCASNPSGDYSQLIQF